MIISNESMGFNDPKELGDPQLFDDPQLLEDPQLLDGSQLFDDQLEVWTLIIQKSTVIPPSRMVLFFITLLINMQFILFQLADLTADSVSERL